MRWVVKKGRWWGPTGTKENDGEGEFKKRKKERSFAI